MPSSIRASGARYIPPPNTPEFATATEYPVKVSGVAVDRDVPARGLPGGERAQRPVQVDRRAEREPRGVRDHLHVGVQPGAGDPEVGAAAGLRQVDPPLAPGRDQLARRHRVGGDAQLAGEVVAAAAGEHGEHARAVAQLARDGAGEPVAAHRRGDLAGVAGLTGQLAGVVHRGGPLDAEARADAPQRRLDRGQQPRGAAGAGARVDDQADVALHVPIPARARRASPRRAWAAGRRRRPGRARCRR